MRKETAREFWQRYLRLVCGGSAAVSVENPFRDFAVRTRAGEFDDLSDDEYDILKSDHEDFNIIWNEKRQRSAGDVLLDALRLTTLTPEHREVIVDLLADCSQRTDYRQSAGKNGAEPQTAAGPSPCASPRRAFDGPRNWSPRGIYDYLSHYILGQEEAKRAAAMLLYNHAAGRRSTAVFCGPSGCGKSEIWRCLARLYPWMIRLVDASRLSADGWRGSVHVRDIFEGVSPEDLQRDGLIVVLDEADKVCCETIMSNGTDHSALIQNSLLKVLDGDVVEFGAEDRRPALQVDCSTVSVVMLGAFEKLMQSKGRTSGGIGFGVAPRVACDYGNTKITYNDLIAAGMRREIAGRINRIVPLSPLSVSDYQAILTGPLLDDLQTESCCIDIDGDSAELLAREAAATGLGVRWMRSKLMNAVDDLMFDNPVSRSLTLKFSPDQ